MPSLLMRVLGGLLALVAALVFLVSLMDLIDPVGTKMADDNDPFGVPDPWYVPGAMALGSVAIGGSGVWLLVRKRKPHEGAV